MRRALALLVVLVACSGTKDSTPTGLKPVASVTVSLPAPYPTSILAGTTVALNAATLDAQGGALTGRVITWATSAAAVVTVSTTGLVTGVGAGQATVTATSEGKSAQTVLTVLGCTGVAALNVGIGEVHTLTTTERQLLCLPGGASGGEYVLIPFSSVTDTLAQGNKIPFFALASGTSATTGAPALTASASLRAGAALSSPVRRLDHSFELGLRQRARDEFGPILRSLPRGGRSPTRARPLTSLSGSPGPVQAIRGLPTNPTVGATVTLNANALSSCANATNRTARVAALSNNAIVLVDQNAPAGGFTDAEYLSIATTFDTLVFPLDTTLFGKPFDMDGNGRVGLFFTTAVNALTPPTSQGIVGGFFFERDLFPVVGTSQVPFSCQTSNEGEMFYLPVLDPNSQFNGFFKNKATLQSDIIGTLAHEFQHLINASRRMYVTVAEVDFEAVWLNEGMSHIAEELLYYHVAGMAPKTDIGYLAAVATTPKLDAINAFQLDNLGRYHDYLAATDVNSPYALNDSLATRGATWNLLRWALDQLPNPPGTYLKALVDSDKWGQPNFNQVFAGLGGILGATRQEVVANFFDNAGITIAAQYAFPSWNYRDILPHIGGSTILPFALKPKVLLPGSPQTYSLVGGGSGYLRFRVNSGTTAGVSTSSGGAALPSTVELILVRTQ